MYPKPISSISEVPARLNRNSLEFCLLNFETAAAVKGRSKGGSSSMTAIQQKENFWARFGLKQGADQ